MGDNGGLAFVLSLCVGVLVCLLFPTLGQALSEGLRQILARADYTLIAAIVLALLIFEWLFALFLDQVLGRRSAKESARGEGRAMHIVLIGCAWVGGLSLAMTFFWAINKPVGPYW